MSDRDVAIVVTELSRMFKRYRHPRYRVMEAFRLPLPRNAYDEFWALRGISLELRRGDSFGIIGQNGAGKSTLLNIICGRLQATSGSVTVHGTIQALMEMGTGFHPEFTGRENIFTSLAYQGVTGREAKRRFEDIVDFSELEEFIDQPIKTYSTGMYSRLAFSTATAIDPDVLIIDEILGTGDAYFGAKCAQRMHRLTRELGATVLFVSHDIGSVQKICERAMWIDRGQIRMEADTLTVSKAYHAWVLERDEARLRAETSRTVGRMRGAGELNGGSGLLQVHLVRAEGQAPKCSHAVARVAIVTTDGRRLEVSPGGAMDNDPGQSAYISTDVVYSCWSKTKLIGARSVRCFEDTGGASQNAPVYFRASPDIVEALAAIEVEHAVAAGEAVAVEIHDGTQYRRLGLLTPGEPGQGWRTEILPIAGHRTSSVLAAAGEPPAAGMAARASPVPPAGGAFVVGDGPETEDDEESGPRDKWETTEARFLSVAPCAAATLARKHIFARGEDIVFRILVETRIDLPSFWVVAVVYDAQGNRTAVLAKEAERVPAGTHEFLMTVKNPTIRQGEYFTTVEILPELDFNWRGKGRIPYLCMWDRRLHFKIDEDYQGTIDLGRVYLPVSLTRRIVTESADA